MSCLPQQIINALEVAWTRHLAWRLSSINEFWLAHDVSSRGCKQGPQSLFIYIRNYYRLQIVVCRALVTNLYGGHWDFQGTVSGYC